MTSLKHGGVRGLCADLERGAAAGDGLFAMSVLNPTFLIISSTSLRFNTPSPSVSYRLNRVCIGFHFVGATASFPQRCSIRVSRIRSSPSPATWGTQTLRHSAIVQYLSHSCATTLLVLTHALQGESGGEPQVESFVVCEPADPPPPLPPSTPPASCQRSDPPSTDPQLHGRCWPGSPPAMQWPSRPSHPSQEVAARPSVAGGG